VDPTRTGRRPVSDHARFRKIEPVPIGILKNQFLGWPMRAKGFAHRELALAWGVLTHNLWMLARLRKRPKKAIPLQQAAWRAVGGGLQGRPRR
jgi:hypothetical protein